MESFCSVGRLKSTYDYNDGASNHDDKFYNFTKNCNYKTAQLFLLVKCTCVSLPSVFCARLRLKNKGD